MNPERDIDGTVAAVVLAGGLGRRIGGGKPLRLLGGERLADRALANARRFSSHIALSIGSDGRVAGCDVPQIVDPEPDWGALGGLAAGLDFAAGIGADLVLTLPCDSPFLPDDLLTRLRAALGPMDQAAIPGRGDRLHVACGLWRVGLRKPVADFAGGGGRALHGLIERIDHAAVHWPAEGVDPFFNINSPEDLRQAELLLPQIARQG